MSKQENRQALPFEPIITLTLIGLLLTGVTLYYKAVNLQRFLEPALAVLEPRVTFTAGITKTAQEKFGRLPSDRVIIRGNSLRIHKSLFTSESDNKIPVTVRLMANFIRTILEDKSLSNDIQSVMIKTYVPLTAAMHEPGLKESMRIQAESVLKTILLLDPAISNHYAHKMAAFAMYSQDPSASDWLTLEVAPSEMLHIKVLERMGKYASRPQDDKASH